MNIYVAGKLFVFFSFVTGLLFSMQPEEQLFSDIRKFSYEEYEDLYMKDDEGEVQRRFNPPGFNSSKLASKQTGNYRNEDDVLNCNL